MSKVAQTDGHAAGGAWRNAVRAGYGLGVGFAIAALVLTGIFHGAGWYADRVSIPRYCENPAAAVQMVQRVLTEKSPAAGGATRPYLIAAKLIYLLPRRDGETLDAYGARLRRRIAEKCRDAGLGAPNGPGI
ncbi:MAG: hypothetical protein ACE5GS_10130 [Kiloniellaceae bacterium]